MIDEHHERRDFNRPPWDPMIEVTEVKGIVNFMGGPWWRHPISWWKMRHFRADVKALEDSSPFGEYLAEKIRENEDNAFLIGDTLDYGMATREDR